MKLIKEEKINREISDLFVYDFALAEDGLYLIEVIASAKSWWQNLKNFKSFFSDDDLAIKVDNLEFPKQSGKTGLFDAEMAWNGNQLKGLSKTGLVAVFLNAGAHAISFLNDIKPFVKNIKISKIEEENKIVYIPTQNNPAENGNRRPWLSLALVNMAVSGLKIIAKADKQENDDDDLKLIINGETQINDTAKAHKNWYWCGKILKGGEKEFNENIKLENGWHYIELWADEGPFLKRMEIFLSEENKEKIIKTYSYKGVNGHEDYNRYDEIIKEVVGYWNGEFLKDAEPVREILDPNLVKAMIFQESRVGYDKKNNGDINVMQVGNYGDPSLDVLNGKGKKAEYELRNGRLWEVNYEGKAKIEEVYDSIYWGVRWLYHKAQGIGEDGKRPWFTWQEAVRRYGPGTQKYTDNVRSIYLKGVDNRVNPPLKLWTVILLILLSGLTFLFYDFSDRPIKSAITAAMSADEKAYIKDIEITRYGVNTPLFLAVIVREKDWSEDFKAGIYKNGKIKWLTLEKEPAEQSILAVKFLRLKGFDNPLIEVYGKTHVGYGALYLYEVRGDRLGLLFQTPAVDSKNDGRWAPENYVKYGFGHCGEVFSGGRLRSGYKDLNNDNISDIILSGAEEIICEKEFSDRSPGEDDYEVKVASAPVNKVFLWNKSRRNWSLE